MIIVTMWYLSEVIAGDADTDPISKLFYKPARPSKKHAKPIAPGSGTLSYASSVT